MSVIVQAFINPPSARPTGAAWARAHHIGIQSAVEAVGACSPPPIPGILPRILGGESLGNSSRPSWKGGEGN